MRYLLFVLAVPLLAQQDVNGYAVEKEQALGRQLASEIRKQSKPYGDPATDVYVQRIGKDLVAELKDAPFDFQFEVIAGGHWAEPISVMGGIVFVPARAFLTAQDEAEFVGLLAHSIGHVALRHGTRSAQRGQAVNLASIPLIFMGGWDGTHVDSRHPQSVLTPIGFREFQRNFELEADRFGVELANRAGYDPAALLRYVERTPTVDTKNSPLPARDMRLTKLQEAIASLPSLPKTSSSGDEFQRVQEAVRATLEVPAEPRRIPTLRR